ncbi:hypothetical protein ACOT81_36250 [Streptomyces sp. WI04-05B]|uniref:hypothetical protein n=1 Tax=Streptomyces TaxID=1883 RepID=UPI0029AAEF27|nr:MULTISPECIES: hypothetical protein [unclassified Streptomyces]MDX2546338.1 hypothetical protein [Streptomyces sp. WI04-05B]MDX2589209.1 hypothetical protein [Streptomyces sp. WI04-05A]
MSTPIHRTSTRQSAAGPASARRREGGVRTGSTSARPLERALLEMQSRAGNRATAAVVQRVRDAESGNAAANGDAAPGAKKKDYRDRIAALLDRFKKNLEPIDTFIKGFQTPTNAAFTQQAAVATNDGLKHSAAASGTSAASGNLLTEAAGTVVNGMDAYKNMKDAKKHETGADHHKAKKKAKTKGVDTVVGAASSGSYSAAIAKEATKIQKAADAAVASEASGIASASIGAIKGVRSAFRVGGAANKYKQVKKLGDPHLVQAGSLARLNESHEQAGWAAAEAYAALDTYWKHEGPGQLEAVSEAIDAAWEAMGEARDAAENLQHAEDDVEKLSKVQQYAKKKQLTKIGKETAGGGGESFKAAAGVVTAVAAGTVGLASNPVGWGLAGAGAGLVLGVTMYKALRAATKRYEEVHHPERWAPQGETPAEAASRTESLKHAMKFWKKVSKGERQAMAREIYALAAGPDISGNTTAEMRESARSLLIALKSGPAKHKLEPDAWAETLNDPAKTSGWIAEIAEQLASG